MVSMTNSNTLHHAPWEKAVPAAHFLKLTISSAINTTQGINDSREKTMPNTPADDGMVMKNPDANPHRPTDFLNLGLLTRA